MPTTALRSSRKSKQRSFSVNDKMEINSSTGETKRTANTEMILPCSRFAQLVRNVFQKFLNFQLAPRYIREPAKMYSSWPNSTKQPFLTRQYIQTWACPAAHSSGCSGCAIVRHGLFQQSPNYRRCTTHTGGVLLPGGVC